MKNKKQIIITAAILVACLAVSVILSLASGNSEVLDSLLKLTGINSDTNDGTYPFTVSYIDVGQGDSALIQSDGINILIDSGEKDACESVVSYLKEKDVISLDYVVVSHPHSDHIGSMSDVFDEFEVKNVIMPELDESNTPSTALYENFLDDVAESGANVYAAEPLDKYSSGNMCMTVLAPCEQTDDLNEMSVAVTVSYGEKSFLFTGDAGKFSENLMLENYRDYLDADVFKAGHHGSRHSNSSEFLSAVSPEVVVVSCGKDNSYGHPHKEAMTVFEKFSPVVFRTDIDSTVTISTDGEKLYY